VSFQGGGERLAALLGGHVDMMVIEPQEAGEQIRAGKLRVLAQIAEKPLAGYPNVPTLKEAGYDIKATPQIRAVARHRLSERSAGLLRGHVRQAAPDRVVEEIREDYQLEDSYSNGPNSARPSPIETDMRTQFQQAGIKLVR
jgi:putative tricarboxylic transport membrane protein